MNTTPEKRLVLVRVKNVYGTLKAYPLNVNAKLLAELAGTTTLTRRSLELARDLGYTVEGEASADWTSVQ